MIDLFNMFDQAVSQIGQNVSDEGTNITIASGVISDKPDVLFIVWFNFYKDSLAILKLQQKNLVEKRGFLTVTPERLERSANGLKGHCCVVNKTHSVSIKCIHNKKPHIAAGLLIFVTNLLLQ